MFDAAERIARANTNDLRELCQIANGDPRSFFRGADFSGVDLCGQDLRGFDLTGVCLNRVKADLETKVDLAFEPAIRPYRRPTPRPIAFLSYARKDDEYSDGKISEFRRQLRDAYEIVTGDELEIVPDRDDIRWGHYWQKTLDLALAGASFLLPILSPLFFRSPHCRDELRKFLDLEAASQRDDLILPVYWIPARLFDQAPDRPDDETGVLVRELRKRQYKDWRQLRHRDFADPLVQKKLEDLAREIAQIFHRPPPPPLEALGLFRDVDECWCPEMVPLPTGQFVMGSEERYAETPSHLVTIGYRFAVGRYPVTFAEYDRFVAAAGVQSPDDEAWGRQRRPVINVSWDDARAYVAWLSQETGKPYRLLSEAEWEYACRAGTMTRYSWGDDITPDHANYDSSRLLKKATGSGYGLRLWS